MESLFDRARGGGARVGPKSSTAKYQARSGSSASAAACDRAVPALRAER
jgi:hypothetical protein